MGFDEIDSSPEECKRYCDFLCDGIPQCKPAFCLASNILFTIAFATLSILLGPKIPLQS
jgi:hypothetical protein